MVIFGASGELPSGARAGAGADAGPSPGPVVAAGPGLSATAAVDVGETGTVGSASLTRSLRPSPVPADSAIPPKRTRTRSCAVLTGSATPRLEVEPRDADGPLALQPAATAKPTKLTTTAPRRADPQRRPATEAATGTDPLNTSIHLHPCNGCTVRGGLHGHQYQAAVPPAAPTPPRPFEPPPLSTPGWTIVRRQAAEGRPEQVDVHRARRPNRRRADSWH